MRLNIWFYVWMLLIVNCSLVRGSCPLFNRLNSGLDVNTNYTQDMINNWDSYSCDSIPNSLFQRRIDGTSLVDYQYNVILSLSSSGSYCNYVNNNIRNETLELLEMFNNFTLMSEYFVPYLESLLIEKNFTIERKYFIDGFDVILHNGGKKAKLFELVNSFNYFMFCKDNNPYFKQFHTETLPSIVQQSVYKQVQTLEVIFGRNMEESCGMSTIPFFNRTLLCHCTSNSSEITFETLSFFECSSVYVKFWVPLSSHPSLKAIELTFHILQFLTVSIICFIPILVRNLKKWKDHLSSRQTFSIIEKEREEREKIQILNKTLSNSEVSTPQSTVAETVSTIDKSSENNLAPIRSEMKDEIKPDQIRNSMKEHLQHELLRVLCDMKLLTVISCMLGIFCICLYALMPLVSVGLNGGAFNEHYTFLSAALSFLCVSNIPLAGSFVEVLLKLDGKNKTISIHGL